MDQCPLALTDNELNVQNHLKTIEEHGLGPADPTVSNDEFWQDKATKWQTTEGDARAKLCMNCEHYLATTEIYDWITEGPALNLKASALPLTPKWKDVESRPVAFCTLYEITCSPLRTCDSQEPGGPMDDIKVKAIELANAISESGLDLGELVEKSVEVIKMYSMDKIPQWASKKSKAVQRVAINVFNQTLKNTGDEEKARIASLAAMKNAEEKNKVKKSLEDILKSKYS